MKLKVISDGTVFGTKVVNAETGEQVEGVTRLEYIVNVNETPELSLQVLCAEADIEAELTDIQRQSIESLKLLVEEQNKRLSAGGGNGPLAIVKPTIDKERENDSPL